MRSVIVCIALLLLIGVPALAQTNLLTNGSFEGSAGIAPSGWTTWGAYWDGQGCLQYLQAYSASPLQSVVDGSSRLKLEINNGGIGSYGDFGVYQVVPVTNGVVYNFSAWERCTRATSEKYWAEVDLFNYKLLDIGDIDSSYTPIDETANSHAIWRRGATATSGLAGGTVPTVATSGGPGDSWEKVTGSVSSTTGFVTVVFRCGHYDTPAINLIASDYVDAASLTAPVPEPSSLLALFTGALGLVGFVVRKR